MLRLNLWRAWLVIKPQSMRLLIEDPGEVRQVPRVLELTHEALQALGFTSIGSHLEQPRFGAASLIYDYVHAQNGVFASLSEAPRWGVRFNRGVAYVPRSEAEGPQARLVLLTPCANDAFVLSANARRPGANLAGRYLSGALPGVTVERLFNAHLRRLAEMSAPAARCRSSRRA